MNTLTKRWTAKNILFFSILAWIGSWNYVLSLVEHEKSFITAKPGGHGLVNTNSSMIIVHVGQGRHWYWDLTAHHAIEEKTIDTNSDWVYNQNHSQIVHIIDQYNTWLSFWIGLETKAFQWLFWFYKLNHHQTLAQICPVALFVLMLHVNSQHFFSHVGTFSCLLGLNHY